MAKDWRVENFESSGLRGAMLVRKPYQQWSATWDHDHCAGCWAKLMEPGHEGEDIQHEGYATTAEFVRGAEYEWVCIECFELFHDEMQWVDVTPRTTH